MNVRKKYWLISLSLLLSFSMLLPVCCDVVAMPIMDDHPEMASHSTHGQQSDAQQCECGHELVKEYQKNKKVAANQVLPVLKFGSIYTGVQIPLRPYLSSQLIEQPPGLQKKSGLSLHLLNSVFLN